MLGEFSLPEIPSDRSETSTPIELSGKHDTSTRRSARGEGRKERRRWKGARGRDSPGLLLVATGYPPDFWRLTRVWCLRGWATLIRPPRIVSHRQKGVSSKYVAPGGANSPDNRFRSRDFSSSDSPPGRFIVYPFVERGKRAIFYHFFQRRRFDRFIKSIRLSENNGSGCVIRASFSLDYYLGRRISDNRLISGPCQRQVLRFTRKHVRCCEHATRLPVNVAAMIRQREFDDSWICLYVLRSRDHFSSKLD